MGTKGAVAKRSVFVKAVRKVKRAMPYHLVERVQVSLQDFEKHPPILVYQMGKVGSMTIYESLRAARLKNPVYHLHFLSPRNMEWEEGRWEAARLMDPFAPKSVPRVRTGRLLLKKLDRSSDAPVYIITGAREPVSWTLSSFFQNVRYFHPELLDQRRRVIEARVLEYLQNTLAAFDPLTDFATNWFDNELKEVFGIDVYQQPFDHEKGYTVIDGERIQVLVLRQEDLHRSLVEALHAFLPVDKPVQIREKNMGGEKKYRQAYAFVKENLKLPRPACERIYSTRYVRHFYTDDMIAGFMRKWSADVATPVLR